MNYTQVEQQFTNKVNPIIQTFINANEQLQANPQLLQQEITRNIIIPKLNELRSDFIKDLSNSTNRNTIVYFSAFLQIVKGNSEYQINDNDMNGFMNAISKLDVSKGLDLILHTPGGVITATESLVNYLRQVFDHNIRVIVPHMAMSAGTMIACASNEIIMGQHSSLGPIDPQYRGVSAEGVIEEFNRAMDETLQDPNRSLIWKNIISQYRPTFVGECEKAIELSDSLVDNWLKTGMFRDNENRNSIVKKIMNEITSHKTTKVHERHFNLTQCVKIGLNVKSLESDKILQDKVLSVYHACVLSVNIDQALIKIIQNSADHVFAIHGLR